MLHFDTKNPNNTDTATFSKSLFAFKPRQVLLAEHNSRSKMNSFDLKEENSGKITSLTPELKASLHHSILHYLHRNGFSKTFKRFQSEAEVQSDTWKASSLHLEDVFCKYNALSADSNLNTRKKPVLGNDEAIRKDEVCATKETTTKKKKKGTFENDRGAIEDQFNATNKKITESGKNCGQISEVNELETKPKKRKTKHDLDSSSQAEEAKSHILKKPVDDTINGLEVDDSTKKKTKEKKKKGVQQDKLEPSTANENEIVTEVEQKERKKKKKKKPSTDSGVEDNQANTVKTDTENETIQPDVSGKEKSSKKRKRSSPDENENLSTVTTITEESKRQKIETSKGEKSKKDGNKVNEVNAEETSNEQLDGLANVKLEINGGEKSDVHKSTKKHHKDSAEPKTVNAFQRVKIDQVEFAHEKLQDNSYWAKNGADIGYGAKAQEVLGQVRGRDFRHEKTKKKRGSYRGGLIDQQSHSIKFNYSDEE